MKHNRCEFSTNLERDITGKPIVVNCGRTATWRKSPTVFGGGIYGCDDCWRKWSALDDVEENSQ